MATEKAPTSRRDNHTVMSQRAGALEFAAAGTPLNATPTERAVAPASRPLLVAVGNAQAAASQAPQTPPPGSCQLCPTLSFFFDGTGNNLDADVGTMQHSNVARLFQSRLEDDNTRNRRSYYIPGLGTYFKEINDPGHTKLGRGMGAKGQARLDWAFTKFDEAIKVAEARAQNPTNKILCISVNVFGFSRGATAARAFVRDLAARCKLKNGEYRLKKGDYPVEVLFLGVFDTVASVGLPMSANTTSLPTTAGWQGYEATLAERSYALGYRADVLAFGEPGADPAPGAYNGHATWADGLQVPSLVKRCVHMVAGHEIRNSFPSDSALDGLHYPPGVSEMVYPGAHSDVGGGYQPGEGARSARHGEMLSLIPLRAMHAAAREAGVPLLSLGELVERSEVLKRSFALDTEGSENFAAMVKLWSLYMRTVGSGGRSVGAEMLAHSAWYLRWHFFDIRRRERMAGQGPDGAILGQREPGFAAERKRRTARLVPLEASSDQAAGTAERDQQRLDAARLNRARFGLPIPPGIEANAVDSRAKADAAKDAYLREKAMLDTYADDSATGANIIALNRRLVEDARAIAKRHAAQPSLKLRPHYRNLMEAYNAQYVRQDPLDADVVAFFDRYVHDSLAGFAQDATLPSDPRVVYAGGNNKIRFAGLDENVFEGQPKAA